MIEVISKEIKSLQVMLPYLNDEYIVGKEIQAQNQNSVGDNRLRDEEYGVVVSIDDITPIGYEGIPRYKIIFENRREMYLDGVPSVVRY